MKLNHLNLTVDDAEAAASFLKTYFGMTEMGRRNANFIFLTDENGIVLGLMKGKDATYPTNFHIGFIQPDEAAVDSIHARLIADGFAADAPTQQHGYTFYIKAPGGILVECLT